MESANLIEWASDAIEAAGIPPGRESNWAIQREHQAEWMMPALLALRKHMHATADAMPYPPRAYRVLDLGTGYGTMAVAAAALGAEVVAIDWHTPLPTLRRPGLLWLRRDIEAPEPLGGPYDAVCMLEVLEHLNCHPLGLFRRIHDALRPGGLFYGSTPDPDVWQEDLPPVALADLPQWHASAQLVDRHTRLYHPPELVWLLGMARLHSMQIERDGAPRYHWRATR